jgi:hypothetical protein
MSPLTVYHIPCNESSSQLPTGFGQCPSTLTMSIPVFNRRFIRYIPWIVPSNQSTLDLHYKSLKIEPHLQFNKTTINALDETFNRLDGPLNTKIQKIRKDIANMQQTTETDNSTIIIACFALTLTVINTAVLFVMLYCLRRSLMNQPVNNRQPTNTHLKAADDNCDACLQPLDKQTDDPAE